MGLLKELNSHEALQDPLGFHRCPIGAVEIGIMAGSYVEQVTVRTSKTP